MSDKSAALPDIVISTVNSIRASTFHQDGIQTGSRSNEDCSNEWNGQQNNLANEKTDEIIGEGKPKIFGRMWNSCLASIRKVIFMFFCIRNQEETVGDSQYRGGESGGVIGNPGKPKIRPPKLHVKINVPEISRIPSVSDFDWTLDTMPEMYGVSPTLSNIQVSDLFIKLPARLRLVPWTCLFRTDKDGYSLARLYSCLKPFTCPVILIIEDRANDIFGALLSSPNIKMFGKRYFGNAAETFLFAFNSMLTIFYPTGSNDYFMQGMRDGLSIGGGRPAIWIDDDLDHGRSLQSETFDNYPLCCPPEFRVSQLECWGLDETYKFGALGLNVSHCSNSLSLNSCGLDVTDRYGSRQSSTFSRGSLRSMGEIFGSSHLNSSHFSSSVLSLSPSASDNISRALPGWRSPNTF